VQHDVSALRATSRKQVPLKSDERVLFQRGTTVEGIQFQGFRIPTITRLKNGSLYASAEARYGRKPAAGRAAHGAVQSYPSVLVSCCNAELTLAFTLSKAHTMRWVTGLAALAGRRRHELGPDPTSPGGGGHEHRERASDRGSCDGRALPVLLPQQRGYISDDHDGRRRVRPKHPD